MRAVIFDPSLAAFGHHVDFNKHVVRLLGQVFDELIFLDIEGIMAASAPHPNVSYRDISDGYFGGNHEKNLSAEEFEQRQKTGTGLELFWSRIAAMKPAVVVMTSEGRYRGNLYNSIPEAKSFHLSVVVHVIWSMLKSLEGGGRLKRSITERVDNFFVLEPFLIDAIGNHGVTTTWFPLRSYSHEECAELTALPRIPATHPRIGTVGVINDRRNNKFLIDSMAQVSSARFDYIVAGQLMGSVADDVTESVTHFRRTSNNQIATRFDYLSNDDFLQILDGLDLGLLAYDSERNLQASAAIYSYSERGVPLLVPDIELFRNYDHIYPGLLFMYTALDSAALAKSVEHVCSMIGRLNPTGNFQQSRLAFFETNSLDCHASYVCEFYRTFKQASTQTAFALGNRALRRAQFGEAVNYYRLTQAANHDFHPAYGNSAAALSQMGSDLAASRTWSKAIALNDKINSIGDITLSHGGQFDILVYPVFTEQAQLNEFLARLYWHFHPIVEFIANIHLFAEFPAVTNISMPPYLSDRIHDLGAYFDGKLKIHPPSELSMVNLDRVEMSFIWKYTTPEERSKPFPKEISALYKKAIWRVDELHERFATSLYLRAASNLLNMERTRERSLSLFKEFAKTFTAGRSAVFGTGPSLSSAFEKSFRGIDTIAANSMVKNIQLLDHLQPKLIVCADPIFHAGASTYAEEFREQLRVALNRYQCPLLVPERDIHIYLEYFKNDGLSIMAVPFVTGDLPNYHMSENFHVTTTGNILTLFLLQVALSLSDTVDIYGCDGRPKSENSYFWGHDKSAQFNERMDDIKLAHPAFFNISYDDYYDQHCETLELWLSHAESIGKSATSQTFSHIDALVKRESR